MKKFLAILGTVFLLIIVFLVANAVILFSRGRNLDKECSAYADAALKAIATDWNEKALLDRASPELKKAGSIEQLDANFRRLGSLGHLQRADPMKGQAGIFSDTRNGERIQGRYTANAQFEKAEAEITFYLIK